MTKKSTVHYQSPAPKIAITHDWLIGGGAEQVVLELHKMFPDAPIYTSYCSEEWREKLDGKVITGYLQHFAKLRKFVPILQYFWFRSIDLSGYDIIFSSTGNGMAKAIKKPKNATHICYCHTPVHYLWRHYEHYVTHPGFGIFNSLARLGLKILIKPLQKLDYKAAQAVDQFIANSNHIKNDIKKYYHKDSMVIFPPVDTERFNKTPLPVTQSPSPKKRSGYVTVGRLVPMKKVNIIIEACNELKVPLAVIGGGPEYNKLLKIAGPTVKILGKQTDEFVEKHMAGAEAFLFASFEDFGITPIEAMAAGTPVIAYKNGGALDYINQNTGIFFDEQTPESIAKAIKESQKHKWDHHKISIEAQKFSSKNFRKKFSDLVNKNS